MDEPEEEDPQVAGPRGFLSRDIGNNLFPQMNRRVSTRETRQTAGTAEPFLGRLAATQVSDIKTIPLALDEDAMCLVSHIPGLRPMSNLDLCGSLVLSRSDNPFRLLIPKTPLGCELQDV